MIKALDGLGKVLPVLAQVVDVIEAIADCADDGEATPEEIARLLAALKALTARIRVKGQPLPL